MTPSTVGTSAQRLRYLLHTLRSVVSRGVATNAAWAADHLVFEFFRAVVLPAAVVAGLWAAALTLPLHDHVRHSVTRLFFALLVAIVTLGAARSAARRISKMVLAKSGIGSSASIFVNITRVL